MRQLDNLIKRHLVKQERDDYRTGLICATLANIYRDTKKQQKAFTPFDFMPNTEKPKKKKQTPEQMFHMVELLNAAYGGQVH